MDWEEFPRHIQAMVSSKSSSEAFVKQFRKAKSSLAYWVCDGCESQWLPLKRRSRLWPFGWWLKICRISADLRVMVNLSMMWMRFWLCFVIVVIWLLFRTRLSRNMKIQVIALIMLLSLIRWYHRWSWRFLQNSDWGLAMNFRPPLNSLITNIRELSERLNFAWKLRPVWLMTWQKKCGRYVMIEAVALWSIELWRIV